MMKRLNCVLCTAITAIGANVSLIGLDNGNVAEFIIGLIMIISGHIYLRYIVDKDWKYED